MLSFNNIPKEIREDSRQSLKKENIYQIPTLMFYVPNARYLKEVNLIDEKNIEATAIIPRKNRYYSHPDFDYLAGEMHTLLSQLGYIHLELSKRNGLLPFLSLTDEQYQFLTRNPLNVKILHEKFKFKKEVPVDKEFYVKYNLGRVRNTKYGPIGDIFFDIENKSILGEGKPIIVLNN